MPLVLLQHLRGNLDNWDPPGQAVRPGRSARLLDRSFVAQQIALIRPDIVRRLVLASSAPQGAAGMHGWAPEVITAVGAPEPNPEGYLGVFFTASDSSRKAGMQAWQRMQSRTADRDAPTTWATREAQYDAVCAWGPHTHSSKRSAPSAHALFVANGDSDPMILPRYSHLLAGLIPQAQIKIYPDSAHGFLFQHHAEFAADVMLSWPLGSASSAGTSVTAVARAGPDGIR